MKTKVTFLACLLTAACFGQDLGDDQVPKNKKGNEILPKEKDFGIGFNTIPILNFFMEAVTAAPGSGGDDVVGYTSNINNQITGKYFLKAKTAIRMRFGVNSLSGASVNRVQNSRALYEAGFGTNDDVERARNLRVEDRMSFDKTNIMLSVGIEKRRGYRRLQGFYGGEIGFGTTSASESISYGNAYSDQYVVHYTSDFGSMQTSTVNPVGAGKASRPTNARYRGGVRFGVRGFVGIEYFIFAKISIAAEYGWGYSWASQRPARSEQEVYINGQNGPTVYKETVNNDSRQVLSGFSVDNNNGSVFSLNNTSSGNTSLSGGAGALTLLFHF